MGAVFLYLFCWLFSLRSCVLFVPKICGGSGPPGPSPRSAAEVKSNFQHRFHKSRHKCFITFAEATCCWTIILHWVGPFFLITIALDTFTVCKRIHTFFSWKKKIHHVILFSYWAAHEYYRLIVLCCMWLPAHAHLYTRKLVYQFVWDRVNFRSQSFTSILGTTVGSSFKSVTRPNSN